MGVPYTFASATNSIPLSQLDANFNTPVTIGSTTVGLGNTVSTLTNVTLSNATITSVSTPITVPQGGTGLTSLTAGYIPFGAGTSAFGNSSNLFWDNTNSRLGIGTNSPSYPLDLSGTSGIIARFTGTTNSTGVSIYSSATSYVGDLTASNTVGFNASSNYVSLGTNGTERMRIDSSGNVGIGLSTMTAKFVVAGTAPYGSGSQATYPGTIQINESGSFTLQTTGGLEFKGSVFGAGYGAKIFGADNGILIFGNRSNSATWTEAMRIDQGSNLLVGTTSNSVGGVNTKVGINGDFSGSYGLSINSTVGSGNAYQINFGFGGSQKGYIFSSSGGTTYATVSDYRLKQDVAPMVGALDKVSTLKPVTYKWKSDNSDGQGFIAHELQEVCPDAVNGEKDAVDEDGKPKYQGIDTSFLVATLTAAIQELNAKVTALEAKLGA